MYWVDVLVIYLLYIVIHLISVSKLFNLYAYSYLTVCFAMSLFATDISSGCRKEGAPECRRHVRTVNSRSVRKTKNMHATYERRISYKPLSFQNSYL
jgi:hypothetical protein